MTELPDSPGRIDLRMLAPDDAQRDRVVGAVMARLGSRPQLGAEPAGEVLETVAGFLPPRWVLVAAVLVVVISAALVSLTRDASPTPEETVAAWADRQHVPTNGELLSTFLGYPP